MNVDYSVIKEAREKITEGLLEVVRILEKYSNELISGISDAISVMIEQESTAMIWAEENRPEWVKIYYRTKKARIRKKYHDRIMRAYMKETIENCGTNKDGGAGEF